LCKKGKGVKRHFARRKDYEKIETRKSLTVRGDLGCWRKKNKKEIMVGEWIESLLEGQERGENERQIT